MSEENQIKRKRRGPELKGERLERFRVIRRKLASVENRDITDVSLLDEVVLAWMIEQEERFGIKPQIHEVHSMSDV